MDHHEFMDIARKEELRQTETPEKGCANCGAENPVIKVVDDMICTKCADILIAPFHTQKWRDEKLAKRRDLGLLRDLRAHLMRIEDSRPAGTPYNQETLRLIKKLDELIGGGVNAS